MSKVFRDDKKTENREWLPARIFGGIMFVVVILLTFIINPNVNNDKFTNETMWEAVHPFKWWDIFGLLGMVFIFLYILGFGGKIVYRFTGPKSENSFGLVHLVAFVCALLMVTMYL